MISRAIMAALLELLNRDPRPALFGFRAPGIVRARALLGLEDRDESDFLVRHATKDIPAYAPMQELLDSWNRSGHWGINRLLMKSHGEGKAKRMAIRQAVNNVALLVSYGHDFANEKRLRRFAAFVGPPMEAHARKRRRVTPMLAHYAAVLAGAGNPQAVSSPLADQLLSWWDELDADSAAAIEASYDSMEALNSISLCLPWWLSMGKDCESICRTALEWWMETPARSSSEEKMNAIATPSIRFHWGSVIRLGLSAGLHYRDERIKAGIERLVQLQCKDGLWKTTREEPFADENLFLTLEIVLMLKQLVTRCPEVHEEQSTDESGD